MGNLGSGHESTLTWQGLEQLATHRVPLEDAPEAYRMFQEKSDGCIKVVLKP
ncbi:hypothetical protein [Propioniciclava sinopodophylli]|uniref:hypothetical protein n=1 Tax=Propioniciclava sinopodophylli TaxID=1837344 RepID=UPI002492F951|nr:hypothetical protein [Propioniciclava sinopodophylli]